ncbi:MAG TPA: ABC transporter permease [Patescibacteria group bacterium]|nr:ABC transporter permease [Patescibacteria group bacterium]
MMIFTYIGTALRQLAHNKGRSALTMLGIIIGIGSVIFIMTLGEVAKNFLLNQISQFGTNVIEVGLPSSMGLDSSEDIQLSEDDVDTLYNSSLLPELTAISAGYSASESLEYNGETQTVTVWGDYPEYFDINHLKIVKGRFFNATDVTNASRVVVIDEKLARDVFHSTDVIGTRIKIGGTFLTIIGIMQEMNFGPGTFGMSMVYSPLSTVKQLYAPSEDMHVVSFLLIEFESGTDTQSFRNRLEYELRRSHDLLNTDEDPFMLFSRDQALSILDTVLVGIQTFVSAVAAISLLVGGIGIMNIMLVTVKERTKEIGLRKAIGAKNNSVLIQFLVESIVLTTVGGVIGIVLGLGLSSASVAIANMFQPDWGIAFVFVPEALIIACGVSITVGLVFGLYPAFKASKLSPIEALRYE